uniref:Uncharacterized protein n=1 Tax=Taeniopygia guttata TaxID=59729 RepID=A0A674GH72_TAEGU
MMRSQCLLGLRSFVAFAAKLWSFVLYLLRRQVRTVIQYQTVRYDVLPLSPISRNRLSGDRQTPREVLRAQTAPRGFLPGGGEPVVRAGGVHGQHGDLRLRRGQQAGQQPQHPQPALLPTALHAGVGQLHQRPVGGAQRPVQHRHPGQLTWRLPQPPRYPKIPKIAPKYPQNILGIIKNIPVPKFPKIAPKIPPKSPPGACPASSSWTTHLAPTAATQVPKNSQNIPKNIPKIRVPKFPKIAPKISPKIPPKPSLGPVQHRHPGQLTWRLPQPPRYPKMPKISPKYPRDHRKNPRPKIPKNYPKNLPKNPPQIPPPGSVQHRHPGQLTWRLPQPPRQRHPHQVVVQ